MSKQEATSDPEWKWRACEWLQRHIPHAELQVHFKTPVFSYPWFWVPRGAVRVPDKVFKVWVANFYAQWMGIYIGGGICIPFWEGEGRR